MHLRAIHLKNAMTHEDTKVTLPEAGIVLVRGPNGGGKSGIFVEGPATACWNKTLRGKPPWSGDPALVEIETSEFSVKREKLGKKTAALTWAVGGVDAASYDTPTKAQSDFETLVGPFEVWKRVSVFSSADAAHFSLATDAERKRMLESILGLQKFDEGLKACRADLAENTRALNKVLTEESVLRERIAGLRDRLKDLDETEQSELAVLPERVAQKKVSASRQEITELQAQIREATATKQAAFRKVSQADAELNQARRARANLDKDACPTCAQAIPHDHRASLRAGVEAAEKLAQRLTKESASVDTQADKDIADLRFEIQALEAYVRKAERIDQDHATVAGNTKRRHEKKTTLEAELAVAARKIAEVSSRVTILKAEQAELEVVEQVLGLKGPRVHMLATATKSLTLLANGWLARLFPGVTVTLQEEKEKLVLDVQGLPHEHGYEACSSGQRRRIDIALLFALSDLESASRGVTRGTLVLDEVTDALDDEGKAAFAEVVEEIAEERCVVIITHVPLDVHPRKILRVTAGKVEVLRAA